MIIRSQDKRKITMDMNLYIEPRDSETIGNVTCWLKNGTMGILGTYSSWDKAIKVLDVIQDFYCKCESAKVVTSGIWGLVNKHGTLEDAEKFRDEHRTLFVFQMPQDSEV